MMLQVHVSDVERDVVEAMRLAGRYASDADAVRTAIWTHAQHLGVDVPVEAFAVGERQPSLFVDEVVS